jgi:hypothetical protein
MSQTMQAPDMDAYLATQVAPTQDVVLDPQFGSVRMITPVGRLSYVTLIKPRAVQQQGRVSDPKFSVTILLNPAV